MKPKFLLIAALSFSPTLVFAQSEISPGVDTNRYAYCINEGLGRGKINTSPQAYCQQWAGPSFLIMRKRKYGMESMEGSELCGMTWNGSPIYMTIQRCKAYMSAARTQELNAHKEWLAQRTALEEQRASAAKINSGAIYNCSFLETSTPANVGGYPPIQVPFTALAQQITADSLNNALTKAGQIAKSYTNSYWVITASCNELILLRDL